MSELLETIRFQNRLLDKISFQRNIMQNLLAQRELEIEDLKKELEQAPKLELVPPFKPAVQGDAA
jgi:hypothetical protein